MNADDRPAHVALESAPRHPKKIGASDSAACNDGHTIAEASPDRLAALTGVDDSFVRVPGPRIDESEGASEEASS